MNRLKEKYMKQIVPAAKKEFKLSNVMEVPVIKKVSINAGIGAFRDNREAVDSFITDLSALAGQKPYPRAARLSEAGFKVRKGDVVGYTITLRREKMWAFLDKFINLALPRVRDFRGLSETAFDQDGNYSVGIKEHVIFPEVNPNTTKGIRSMQITIVTNSRDKKANQFILKELGMPFRKEGNK
jgi:large subunit ribosomal protein L5